MGLSSWHKLVLKLMSRAARRRLAKLFGPPDPLRGKPRPTVRLCLEELEARWMPSTGQTFIVNDPGNPTGAAGKLTLAQAITKVDADTGSGARDVIQFNIPGGANQVQTINIAAAANALPVITQPVLIDGWSEGNFENATTG